MEAAIAIARQNGEPIEKFNIESIKYIERDPVSLPLVDLTYTKIRLILDA